MRDKLRLDFNENTVGASPKVIEYLREHLSEPSLAVYPEYGEVKQELAAFFDVETDDFTLTNGTDEAIQVLINTYVDDGDEVLLLRPSYAMYRFYAEVAGAAFARFRYRDGETGFPVGRAAGGDSPDHARRADRQSEQPDWHRDIAGRNRTDSRKGQRSCGSDG